MSFNFNKGKKTEQPKRKGAKGNFSFYNLL